MRYALKIRQFPTHPSYHYIFSRRVLSIFKGRTLRSAPLCLRMQNLFTRTGISLRNVMRVDITTSPPWQSIQPQIDLSLADVKKGDILPTEARSRAMELISSYEGHTLTFTDGSKTANGVGCAFVSGHDTRSFSLPSNSSVFTSELVAISKALCFAEIGSEDLHLILTDSLSSLLALKSFILQIPFYRRS